MILTTESDVIAFEMRTLDKDFATQYNHLQKKYGEEFAKLNGFSADALDYTQFIDNFIDSNVVADASIDSSANVHNKDVVALDKEMSKPHKKLIAFNKIYYEIKKEYGKDDADLWLELEWCRQLYMHDAPSASEVPYCYAYDITRLATEGMFFTPSYNNQPAKHASIFVSFIKEFVSYTSNRTSGACGLPNVIPFLYWFCDMDIKHGYLGLTEAYREKFCKQIIQEFIYAVNQTYVRDNIQSAFTNTSIFDHEYMAALFGAATFPDGTYMLDHMEDIMQFQMWFLEEMAEIHEQNMFTFPVNTLSFLYQNGEFCDIDWAKKTTMHNMKWYDSNIFTSDEVTSLSNCCRLKSSIKDLGFFNSVGGTSLRVGSVKVSTINLARIALECDTEKDYIEKLKQVVLVDLKALDRQRHIIKRNIEKGLLPNYCDGLIDLSTQYSTIGIIGVYEVMRAFNYTYKDSFDNTFYSDDAYRFGTEIFNAINEVKDKFTADKDYQVNIEQVPAEQAAVKFLKADSILYPNKVINDLPLYGNQFIPLGIQTTLQERIKIASAFDKFCNGGSISHINVESSFSNFDQMWKMLHYIADAGCTYYAFNTKINSCKNNHAFHGSTCPSCGNPTDGVFTRIVGFYTKVNTWSKERRAEFDHRAWMDIETEARSLGILD